MVKGYFSIWSPVSVSLREVIGNKREVLWFCLMMDGICFFWSGLIIRKQDKVNKTRLFEDLLC